MTHLFSQSHLVYSALSHPPAEKGVLVVGDLMLDRHLFGDVSRISPEAPVPVVRFSRETLTPGGAGNVATNLRHLGAKVTIIGVTGEDPTGGTLKELLAREGIRDLSPSLPNRPTATKTRIIGGHQQMLRLDVEDPSPLLPAMEDELIRRITVALDEGIEVAILSDYAKGVVTERIARHLIQEGKRRGIPVLVDPKGLSYEKYRGATALTPNRQELLSVLHLTGADLELLVKGGQSLLKELELEFLLLTRSEEGMSIILPERVIHIPAQALEVFDVSGAGDTVIATLAFGFIAGLSLEDAVRLSNIAAGIVVGKVGTVPIERTELLSRIYKLERGGGTAHKIFTSLDHLLDEVARWRKEGEKIVFTNGCFDLIHPGHVELLEQAKELGDRLIVGLNSDRSIRRLKGPGRPIISEEDRLRVLSAFEAVDAVILFDEDTPLALIQAIRPDLLVKGGDYEGREVVGAVEVKGWGGEVKLIPLVEGKSTSAIVAKIEGQKEQKG
jgi:D-beta-D-heptose 7-phosphate kinase/D-beta-D-heptose 1-phosphate adenosyltransferase